MPENKSLGEIMAEDLRRTALKEIDRWLRVAGQVEDSKISSVITGIVALYLQGRQQMIK
jgi:hypothetical protein